MMKTTLLFTMFLFIVSCVGTIEQTSLKTTEVVADKVVYENFEGIDEAIAISHDKVEVYFYEAENINSENVAYQIHYDGAEYPIFVPGNSLTPRADSRLMYTIEGLVPNREYYFEVQYMNLLTGQVSASTEKKVAQTFYNRTADFHGVESVVHQPGPDGTNFVKVSWAAATRESSGVIPMLGDVAKYEVTVLNASRLITDFDNEKLTNDERKVTYFNENSAYGIVGGLQPNETYYIRVRAIHHGYYDYLDDPTYQYEKNNKYVKITMLSGDGNEIDFDKESFIVTKPDGLDGINSALANWEFPTGGAFDHFRLIYKGSDPEEVSASAIESIFETINPSQIPCELDPTNYYCRQVDFSTNNANILDLKVDWRYTLILAICLNEACSNYILSEPRHILTFGDVANFDGFLEFEIGDNFDELSNLILKVTPPDLSQGLLDGITIYYDIDDGRGNYQALNPFGSIPTQIEGSDLILRPYDFTVDDEILLHGLSVDNLLKSFFNLELPKVYYFKYARRASSEEIEEDLAKSPFAVKPTIRASTDPINILNCDINPSFTRIDWQLPNDGIFTNFKIEVFNGSSLVDLIYVGSNSTSFHQIDYFSTLGVDVNTEISVKIRPVIIYENNEFDPHLEGFEVSEENCTPFP